VSPDDAKYVVQGQRKRNSFGEKNELVGPVLLRGIFILRIEGTEDRGYM
jgi:hypothetical protein